ncbi:hypothetical protein RRF57_007399 [Xylaria bambusicola]|uniref:Uncharacterized protein n=1 Tax=Xylaria bambusicola TaxID=326684 RepID=A0AAN7YZS3_9PEZI
MASLSTRRRRALLPQIDVRVPRDIDNNGDDDDEGRQPTPTLTIIQSPTSISSLHVQRTTVSVTASRETTAQPPITTVTAPAQTTRVTMFVTVSANPVTVTVTARPSPVPETSGTTKSGGVDGDKPLDMDTTMASTAPTVMITGSAQTGSAKISGLGAAFIGGAGVAGPASLSILLLVAKKDVADLYLQLDCQF